MNSDTLMAIWVLIDAGVLSEDQADRIEALNELEASTVLTLFSGPGQLSDEQLEDAIAVARSYLTYFATWMIEITPDKVAE